MDIVNATEIETLIIMEAAITIEKNKDLSGFMGYIQKKYGNYKPFKNIHGLIIQIFENLIGPQKLKDNLLSVLRSQNLKVEEEKLKGIHNDFSSPAENLKNLEEQKKPINFVRRKSKRLGNNKFNNLNNITLSLREKMVANVKKKRILKKNPN